METQRRRAVRTLSFVESIFRPQHGELFSFFLAVVFHQNIYFLQSKSRARSNRGQTGACVNPQKSSDQFTQFFNNVFFFICYVLFCYSLFLIFDQCLKKKSLWKSFVTEPPPKTLTLGRLPNSILLTVLKLRSANKQVSNKVRANSGRTPVAIVTSHEIPQMLQEEDRIWK